LHKLLIKCIIKIGDNMNSIEIYINQIGNELSIYIDTKNNKMKINDRELDISSDDIYELLRIIRTWDNLYEKDNILIDKETFMIVINTLEGINYIRGNGGYPENYSEFKEWIGRHYE